MRTSASPFASFRRGYPQAAGIAAFAVGVQWLLRQWTGDQVPFLFFITSTAICSVVFGRGPALLVAAVGALNALLWFEPTGSLWIRHTGDRVALAVYVALSLVVVYSATRVRLVTLRDAVTDEHLQIAQDDAGVGVYELDFINNTAFVSPTLRRMMGQESMRGAVSLRRWLDALPPEHVADMQRVLAERIKAGELQYEREHRWTAPDGGVRWLLSRVRIELTAGGALAVARGVTVDITQRKQLDENLRRTQAELEQQIADMKRLHVLSQELMRAGDDLPRSMQAVLRLVLDFHDADSGRLVLNGKDPFSVCVGAEAVAAAGIPVAAHETPLLSTSGEPLGAITVSFAHPRDWSDRERRFVDVCASMAAAVVERERARAAVREEERRFAVAIESSGVPFNILAPVRDAAGVLVDLRWRYLNLAGARLFGHAASDLVGRCIRDVMPDNWEVPGLLERFVAVIDRGEAVEFETPASARDTGRWYSVIASPLLGFAAVWFSDISERKRAEHEQREADRRKDEFLATLAHELRNPLAPIRQSIRVVRSAAASEAQRNWCQEVIERQVHNMGLLLDDLLDVSRISRGTLLLRKAETELAGVVEAALELARPHLEAKAHRLELELPPVPVRVVVDRLRLAQVLANLLTNAAKYTDPGGRIALRAWRDDVDLFVRVSDSGIGLTEEQRERVFDMFAQAPSSIGRSEGGLGIGLSLSRSLVRLHAGDIQATSGGPGAGSEFTVRLPLGAHAANPPELASQTS